MSGGSLFNSFDEEELDDGQPESEAPMVNVSTDDDVDEVIEESNEQLDEEMSEAERRINLAGYYKILAKGGVFNDGSEEAALVDGEVREFARERMSLLLNLSGQKPKQELFTEEQFQVLRHLADRYIQKQTNQPAQPVVNPLPPPKPVAAPVVARPHIPQVKPLAPPATAPRPAQSVAKPRAKKPVAAPKPRAKQKVNDDDRALNEPFEENGKQYKIVEHPHTGERMRVHVTGTQVVARHGIPMPSQQEQVFISERQADRDLGNNSALKNSQIGLATAMAITDTKEIKGR